MYRSLVIALIGFFFSAFGAGASEQEPPPATAIERMASAEGVLLVKSFTEIGRIAATFGGSIEVESVSLRHAATGEISRGLRIEVTEGGRVGSDDAVFVDQDEIDGLLAGIEALRNQTSADPPHTTFEAEYTTKGNLEIAVFTREKGRGAAVTAGRIGVSRVFINPEDLAKLAQLIVRGRDVLVSK